MANLCRSRTGTCACEMRLSTTWPAERDAFAIGDDGAPAAPTSSGAVDQCCQTDQDDYGENCPHDCYLAKPQFNFSLAVA